MGYSRGFHGIYIYNYIIYIYVYIHINIYIYVYNLVGALKCNFDIQPYFVKSNQPYNRVKQGTRYKCWGLTGMCNSA